MSDHARSIERIAANLLRAALQCWRDDQAMTRFIRDVDHTTPLDGYFRKVAKFCLGGELTTRHALFFRDKISDADANDVIFLDAARVLEAGPCLNADDIRLLKLIHSTVQWYQGTAYQYTLVFSPANDAAPL